MSEAGRAALSSVAIDAVVTMDHESIVLEFNEVAERTFGYPREEIVGRPMAQYLVPPDFENAIERAWPATCRPARPASWAVPSS